MKWIIVILHISSWNGSVTQVTYPKGEYASKESCSEAIAEIGKHSNLKIYCTQEEPEDE
jgi:hypothetical protein